MPRLRPVSRREFIDTLRGLGFDGPFRGTDHQFMERGTTVVKVPNPHGKDIGAPLLSRILRNAGIPRAEWLGEA